VGDRDKETTAFVKDAVAHILVILVADKLIDMLCS